MKNDIQQILVLFLHFNETAFGGPCLIRTIYREGQKASCYVENKKKEIYNIEIVDYGQMVCIEKVLLCATKYGIETHEMPLYYFNHLSQKMNY